MGAIAVIIILSRIITKNWILSFLIGYMVFIIGETLCFRSVGERRYQLVPFWSYMHKDLWPQIVANVVLFIPFGFLSGKLLGLKGVLLTPVVSLGIELFQLALCCGLFEFDDVIHNSIGAFIGYLLVLISKKKQGKVSIT